MQLNKNITAVVCGDITAALNRRRELMSLLQERSEQSFFFCPDAKQEHLNTIESLGYEVEIAQNNKQSLNIFADIGYVLKLFRRLNELKPEHVFVFHIKQIVYTGIICRLLGIQYHVLFAGLGILFADQADFKNRIIKFAASKLLKFALKDANTVFFQNPDDPGTFEKLKILTNNDNTAVVNGSGVSLTHFSSCPPTNPKPIVFTCITRMIREKGLYDYYEAAKTIKQRWGDEVVIQLIGPFDANPNSISREVVDQWDKEGIIDYLGETGDVRPYLANSSVFVLPSYYMEGTPKIILESLAIGRAIITTNSRGCKETVENGVNGYLIDPRDVQGLIESMDNYMKDRTLHVTHGKNSRILAERRYDVKKVNRTMLRAMGMNKKSAKKLRIISSSAA